MSGYPAYGQWCGGDISPERLRAVVADGIGPIETPAGGANGEQIGGDHYQRMLIQPWDVMRACMSREEWLGFLKGNVIKYVMRANSKGGTEDLRKAQHYLQTLIQESP